MEMDNSKTAPAVLSEQASDESALVAKATKAIYARVLKHDAAAVIDELVIPRLDASFGSSQPTLKDCLAAVAEVRAAINAELDDWSFHVAEEFLGMLTDATRAQAVKFGASLDKR